MMKKGLTAGACSTGWHEELLVLGGPFVDVRVAPKVLLQGVRVDYNHAWLWRTPGYLPNLLSSYVFRLRLPGAAGMSTGSVAAEIFAGA